MKRLAPLLPLLLLAPPAGAATATAALLQPPSSERSLQMEVGDGRAWLLRANGQRLRLPLRRGERIEELIEFDDGVQDASTLRRVFEPLALELSAKDGTEWFCDEWKNALRLGL